MSWFKRIFLFMAVNILVVTTISILLSVLGVKPYLTQYGLNYSSLAVFCLVWGMGGAFISLGISRIMAKMMMGVKLVEENERDPSLRWLRDTVHQQARMAGLPKMPQVGYYNSPELNAFATGPTKSRALVAVSTGLLDRMNKDQAEAVLGHEIAHVANGDMVTMTLVQGIINAFVMFIARIVAFALSQNVKEENRRTVNWISTMVLEILLSFLGMMVVAAFSRMREYRADKGGAKFAGREKMISALEALKMNSKLPQMSEPESIATFKISGKKGSFLSLFSTHPALDDRIAALRRG